MQHYKREQDRVLVLVLLRVLQRNRTNRIYMDIHNEIYCEEWAHTVMEAEKAHYVSSANQRLRKAGGLGQHFVSSDYIIIFFTLWGDP